jgi:hypothetical protein
VTCPTCRHQPPGVAFRAAQLPGQIAPQRAHHLPIALDGLVGRRLDAVEHRDASARQFRDLRRVQDGRDALQVAGRHLALGQVIDRKHRVRLAATERGLQLDDRVAALARQALDHRVEQQAHALGDEGALEEQLRVLVLGVAVPAMNPRQVGRELRLLERALEHILVRYGDFTPRLERHDRRFEETHIPPARLDDTRSCYRLDAGSLRTGQHVGLAEVTTLPNLAHRTRRGRTACPSRSHPRLLSASC